MSENQRIFRSPKTADSRFARIDNALLQDSRLSFRARGVAAHLLSQPINWRFSADSLAANAIEGREALERAIRELIATGYVKRVRERDDAGCIRTRLILRETPTTAFQESEPTTGLPAVGKPSGRSTGRRQTRSLRKDGLKNDGRNNEKKKDERGAPPAVIWPIELPEPIIAELARDYKRKPGTVTTWYAAWVRKKKRYGDPLPGSADDAFEQFKDELRIDRTRPEGSSPKWAADPYDDDGLNPEWKIF